jgi:hypothetical protein
VSVMGAAKEVTWMMGAAKRFTCVVGVAKVVYCETQTDCKTRSTQHFLSAALPYPIGTHPYLRKLFPSC